MSEYTTLKEKHQRELNAFPLGFAYSNQQFNEMMSKWGLSPNAYDKIYRLGGGAYLRKSDADAFHNMTERQNKEKSDAIAADTDGSGFIYQMFSEELSNHEFGYTYNLDETLDALGLTMDAIDESPTLKAGLDLALRQYYTVEDIE